MFPLPPSLAEHSDAVYSALFWLVASLGGIISVLLGWIGIVIRAQYQRTVDMLTDHERRIASLEGWRLGHGRR